MTDCAAIYFRACSASYGALNAFITHGPFLSDERTLLRGRGDRREKLHIGQQHTYGMREGLNSSISDWHSGLRLTMEGIAISDLMRLLVQASCLDAELDWTRHPHA